MVVVGVVIRVVVISMELINCLCFIFVFRLKIVNGIFVLMGFGECCMSWMVIYWC